MNPKLATIIHSLVASGQNGTLRRPFLVSIFREIYALGLPWAPGVSESSDILHLPLALFVWESVPDNSVIPGLQVQVDAWGGLGGLWGGKDKKHSSFSMCASQMKRWISTSQTGKLDYFLTNNPRETSLLPRLPPPRPPPLPPRHPPLPQV